MFWIFWLWIYLNFLTFSLRAGPGKFWKLKKGHGKFCCQVHNQVPYPESQKCWKNNFSNVKLIFTIQIIRLKMYCKCERCFTQYIFLTFNLNCKNQFYIRNIICSTFLALGIWDLIMPIATKFSVPFQNFPEIFRKLNAKKFK